MAVKIHTQGSFILTSKKVKTFQSTFFPLQLKTCYVSYLKGGLLTPDTEQGPVIGNEENSETRFSP